MTNKQIAAYLKQTADLVELTGGNAFRARAFQRAARTIERLEEPVEELLEAGTLTEIGGIGKGLAAEIRQLLDEGSFDAREELLSAIPPGLLDMLRVKGLGAKKVRRLWTELGATSLDELEEAATVGRMAELDGFGKKSQDNVLENIRLLRRYQQRRHYAAAYREAAPLVEQLRQQPGILRAELCGALRRRLETVAAADVLVATEDAAATRAALATLFHAEDDGAGDFLAVALPDGLPVRIAFAAPERFGTAWWRATGSEAHIAAFEERFGTPKDFSEEAEVYAGAGLAFVEPELREDRGEIEAAADGALPTLLTPEDLRGTLHNHSTYSDGTHTLRQMAEHTRRLGLEYFGVCDHSRSLKIAHGMPIERVREQQEEIARLNEEFAADGGPPFRIFSGIESDILVDGALDYPDDVLASFDFVVASVHSRFNMSEEEATARVVRAVENPFTTILGHPTGRLLLRREGYPLDHEAVLDACAEAGVAVELNANPYRLDLDWRWIRAATERGLQIAINPDAHAMDQLSYMRWGVAVARKGWLTAQNCLNARSLDDFAAWLAARRAERAA